MFSLLFLLFYLFIYLIFKIGGRPRIEYQDFSQAALVWRAKWKVEEFPACTCREAVLPNCNACIIELKVTGK